MKYAIEKKTPASNWYTIHDEMDLGTAKFTLEAIKENYDADPSDDWENSLSDDGLNAWLYEGGDLHEFRISEN